MAVRMGLTAGALVASASALVAAAPAAVAAPAPRAKSIAKPQTIGGVVVHRNVIAHSVAIADRHGHLWALRTHVRIGLGHVVNVRARKLADGTFAPISLHVGPKRAGARITGKVSYLDRAAGSFVVSARGVSMLVYPARNHRRARSAQQPRLGAGVTVDLRLVNGAAVAEAVAVEKPQSAPLDVEGVVLVNDGQHLVIGADDDGASGRTLTVALGDCAGADAPGPGQEVELVVSLDAAGNMSIAGSGCGGASQQGSGGSSGAGPSGGDSSGGDSSGDSPGDSSSGDSSGDSSGSGDQAPVGGGGGGVGGDGSSGDTSGGGTSSTSGGGTSGGGTSGGGTSGGGGKTSGGGSGGSGGGSGKPGSGKPGTTPGGAPGSGGGKTPSKPPSGSNGTKPTTSGSKPGG